MLQDKKLGPRHRQVQLKVSSTTERRVLAPNRYGRMALTLEHLYLWSFGEDDMGAMEFLPSLHRVQVGMGSSLFPKSQDGQSLKGLCEKVLDTLASVMVNKCHLRNDEMQPWLQRVDVMRFDTFRYPLVLMKAPTTPICMEFDKGKVQAVKGLGVHSHGYLKVELGLDKEKSQGGKVVYERAHRLVCWAFHGPPPEPDMIVMHTCNMPTCLCPLHLKWGTQKDNSKGRKKKGYRRGVKVKGRKVKKST